MPKATDRNLLVIGDEEYLFDPGKMLLSETIAAEKATGLSWPQVVGGLNMGVMTAVQAVVWLLKKRANPKLKLAEVEFNAGDYQLLDPDSHPDYMILEPGEELPPVEATDEYEELPPEAAEKAPSLGLEGPKDPAASDSERPA